mmetsp:Transcript_6894/g.9849  ORF Transcript_6894/g.9849 Transcript_6894/m.9849 type:complete len:262 (-) Transcript_6894:61-846(-)
MTSPAATPAASADPPASTFNTDGHSVSQSTSKPNFLTSSPNWTTFLGSFLSVFGCWVGSLFFLSVVPALDETSALFMVRATLSETLLVAATHSGTGNFRTGGRPAPGCSTSSSPLSGKQTWTSFNSSVTSCGCCVCCSLAERSAAPTSPAGTGAAAAALASAAVVALRNLPMTEATIFSEQLSQCVAVCFNICWMAFLHSPSICFRVRLNLSVQSFVRCLAAAVVSDWLASFSTRSLWSCMAFCRRELEGFQNHVETPPCS